MILANGRRIQFHNADITFQRGDIRILNHQIAEVGTRLTPAPGETYMDLKGDYVLPGMVNSHSHSYTNLLRGTSYGEPLEIWSSDTVALGGLLSEEDMVLSTSLGICEMLHSGVTACVDHLPHLSTAAAAAAVYQSSGFRAALAPMMHNKKDSQILCGLTPPVSAVPSPSPFLPVPAYMEYYEDFIKRFHHPEGTVQVMAGINSPQRADESLLNAASDLAARHVLGIHCHLLETRWQQASARESGISPVFLMDRCGLLTQKTSLAHCVWLDDEEIALVAQRGSIPVSNPASNLFLGSGVFPLNKWMDFHVLPALGSDGVNCGTDHSMQEILRLFLLLQRGQTPDYRRWPGAADAYRMATTRGLQVLGKASSPSERRDTQSSPIQTGMDADLVIIDQTSLLPVSDSAIANQLLFHNHLQAKHVLIHGRFVLESGVVTCLDEKGLRAETVKRLPYLAGRYDEALKKAGMEKPLFRQGYGRIWNLEEE